MDFERIKSRLDALLEAGKKAELRGALNMLNEVDIAEYFETLFGNILAFKCKNLHFYYKDNALCFSLCPAVFDPDAPGLMQGKKLSQKSTGKD